MALPESIILSRCRLWRVFGTGTWSSPVVPGALQQRRLLYAFLYETAKMAGIPFGRLVWATRHERGEQFGREHYHWLIGAREWNPTKADMFRLNHLWDSLPRCGFSRNYAFDQKLNGVEYVSKCLSSSDTRDTVGAGFYETAKFAHCATDVTLSNALLRLVGGKRVRVLRGGRMTRRQKRQLAERSNLKWLFKHSSRVLEKTAGH